MNPKKTGLTREQAAELYKDLQKSMTTLRGRAANGAVPPPPVKGEETRPLISQPTHELPQPGRAGHIAALTLVITLACSRALMSGFEAVGVFSIESAQATLVQSASSEPWIGRPEEEVRILTALDTRRVELEKQRKMLVGGEEDLARREREFATKLVELRSLTERLRLERDKSDKRKSAQLDQLANVYGSMNPQEAAQLMQQLDVTIALALIQRMPEKRIGQILSLMDREKALSLTQLLTATTGN